MAKPIAEGVKVMPKTECEKMENEGNKILRRRGKNENAPFKEKQEIDTEKYKEDKEGGLKEEERKSLSRSKTLIPNFYASLSCLLLGVIVGIQDSAIFVCM